MSLLRRFSGGNIYYGINLVNKNAVSDLYVDDSPFGYRMRAIAEYSLLANGLVQITKTQGAPTNPDTTVTVTSYPEEWLSRLAIPRTGKTATEFSTRAKCTLFTVLGSSGTASFTGTYETITSTNLEASINTFGPWTPITSDITFIASAASISTSLSLGVNAVVQIAKTSDTSTVLDEAILEFAVGGTGDGGGGCLDGICCFTPETLITMSDLTTKKIVDIEVGDTILVYNTITATNESQKVTGITTRIERPMYRYVFDNDSTLDASDDHPLYVVGVGYAAINPNYGAYKDLESVNQINVGDKVQMVSGDSLEILDIYPIDYPNTVYTLENSRFYANGLLVY